MSKKDKKTKKSERPAEKPVDQPPEPTKVDEHPEQTAETMLMIEQKLEDSQRRLQRLGADYQNYQKRTQKQIEQAKQLAHESLVKSLLPVLDNFEHTLEKGGETKNGGTLLKGVRIVYDHLIGILEGAGLHRIESKPGCEFDPNLHEAMLNEANDKFPENTVVRELAPGYFMNNRTLRPAKVSVVKTPAADIKNSLQEQQPKEETAEN